MNDLTTLDQRVQRYVEAAPVRSHTARYEVNAPMIGLWADALGDANPVYVDQRSAQSTGRAGIVAPPTMLQAWTMPPLSQMASGMRHVPGYAPYLPAGLDAAEPAEPSVNAELAAAGYYAVAATNCRQAYDRELVLGDRLSFATTLDSVTSLKHTAMGPGYFVTTRTTCLDAAGERVGTHVFTLLCFKPPADSGNGAAAPAPTPPAPAADTVSVTRTRNGRPRVGDRLGDLLIPITPTFIIATALATMDFYAIHHDADWARSLGGPGIFTNILTTTGLVGRMVTDWAGPSTRLRSVDLRLLTPNYPDDVLSLGGEVTAVDGRSVEFSVVGQNRLGTHVRATVQADLPD